MGAVGEQHRGAARELWRSSARSPASSQRPRHGLGLTRPPRGPPAAPRPSRSPRRSRPSSFEDRAACRRIPISGPGATPASSRSSPVISRRTWRSSSNQPGGLLGRPCGPPASRPRRPASATASGGAAGEVRVQIRAAGGIAASAPARASASKTAPQRPLALAGAEFEPVEQAGAAATRLRWSSWWRLSSSSSPAAAASIRPSAAAARWRVRRALRRSPLPDPALPARRARPATAAPPARRALPARAATRRRSGPPRAVVEGVALRAHGPRAPRCGARSRTPAGPGSGRSAAGGWGRR